MKKHLLSKYIENKENKKRWITKIILSKKDEKEFVLDIEKLISNKQKRLEIKVDAPTGAKQLNENGNKKKLF